MRVQSCQMAAQEAAEADVLIAPPITAPAVSAIDEQEAAMLSGYAAARRALAGIPLPSRVKPANDGAAS